MKPIWTRILFLLLLMAFLAGQPKAMADQTDYAPDNAICGIDNRGCVLRNLRHYAQKIEKSTWRDQTFRELAKSYAADGYIDIAISIIDDINSPDTKAMTIRGIGMEMARLGYDQDRLSREFDKLRAAAERIDHPPSYAIALTYIAMGQAFAGDNDGSWETAASMTNAALRHKAYGETAEIQAEKGNFDAAMKSIGFIDDEAYRNKAYNIVSKILSDHKYFEQAYKAALEITNDYKKSQSIQYMLDRQKIHMDEQQAVDSQGKTDQTPLDRGVQTP
ncbi:MAG: hypothetical protein CMH27_06375 [Micavibrio sp.]|nr:hypothetical protein [Micavibrio sp.]|tara:strand:+ start:284 stop:1111 length:828 start_codon:yes stop_codon:yes gene_type:complete